MPRSMGAGGIQHLGCPISCGQVTTLSVSHVSWFTSHTAYSFHVTHSAPRPHGGAVHGHAPWRHTGAMAAPSSPRVTVSLVTYNGSRWLPGCLASLASQDLDDVEILVHDNASRDGTQALLRGWAPREPRMRVQESDTNAGYAAAHNRISTTRAASSSSCSTRTWSWTAGSSAAVVAAFEAHPEAGAPAAAAQLAAPVSADDPGHDRPGDGSGPTRDQPRAGPARRAGPPSTEAMWGVDGRSRLPTTAALREARLRRPDGSLGSP